MSGHRYDLAITGDIFQGDRILPEATLLVTEGKIVSILQGDVSFPVGMRIDARGMWILPGVIDSHVHSLSCSDEGFEFSTRSACAGGVTTIVDMPVDAPFGVATAKAFEEKKALVDRESFVDVALLGSVKDDTLEHIADLHRLGCCGYKLSLFDTDPHRFPRVRDGRLLKAFMAICETGLTAGVHAENDEIIKELIEDCIKAGKTHPLAHCESRPEVSETESVLKGLEIARATGVRFHLYHISCSRSIDLANLYRREGCPVTVETCPHYLAFSEDDMNRLGGRLRINPPVRRAGESERLWEKIRTGEIDCVSSDHAPWPVDRKNKESIFDNLCGSPGVETLFPLLFSEGVVKNRIEMSMLLKVLMENPARIFGLYPRKGVLSVGSDADVIIVDPEEKWTVHGANLHSRASWTPYEGMEITGRVKTTLVRGRIVYDAGCVTGEKGFGRFIAPQKRGVLSIQKRTVPKIDRFDR